MSELSIKPGLVWLENSIAAILSTTGPMLIPIVPAYLAFERITMFFDWPWWVGAAAAWGIESTLYTSILVTVNAWEWNRTKRKIDPSAPFKFLCVLVAFGYSASILLVVFLEFFLELRVLSIIFIILMAPSSFAIRGIGQNIERWQKGITEEKAAKRQERAAKKAAKNKPVKISVSEKLPTNEQVAKKKLPKNGLTEAQIKRQKRNGLIISLYEQGKKTREIHQELLNNNYKASERTIRGVISEAKSPELNGK